MPCRRVLRRAVVQLPRSRLCANHKPEAGRGAQHLWKGDTAGRCGEARSWLLMQDPFSSRVSASADWQIQHQEGARVSFCHQGVFLYRASDYRQARTPVFIQLRDSNGGGVSLDNNASMQGPGCAAASSKPMRSAIPWQGRRRNMRVVILESWQGLRTTPLVGLVRRPNSARGWQAGSMMCLCCTCLQKSANKTGAAKAGVRSPGKVQVRMFVPTLLRERGALPTHGRSLQRIPMGIIPASSP
jgi:hypothetical protein